MQHREEQNTQDVNIDPEFIAQFSNFVSGLKV